MKKRILVIEKDKGIQEILNYILATEGFEVKSLNHVNGILSHVEAFAPHAILFDVILTGTKETEVCQEIKSDAKTKHIPIIVLSTSPSVTANLCQ